MNVQGRLEWVPIGVGAWVLVTDSGVKHSLYGEIPDEMRDKRVEVDGRAEQVMGASMVGGGAPILVSRVRVVP